MKGLIAILISVENKYLLLDLAVNCDLTMFAIKCE